MLIRKVPSLLAFNALRCTTVRVLKSHVLTGASMRVLLHADTMFYAHTSSSLLDKYALNSYRLRQLFGEMQWMRSTAYVKS